MRVQRIRQQNPDTQKTPDFHIVHKAQHDSFGEGDEGPAAGELGIDEVCVGLDAAEGVVGEGGVVLAWVGEDQEDAAEGEEGFDIKQEEAVDGWNGGRRALDVGHIDYFSFEAVDDGGAVVRMAAEVRLFSSLKPFWRACESSLVGLEETSLPSLEINSRV